MTPPSDTFDSRSIFAREDAGDPSAAHFGAVALRGAHQGGGERARVNDGGGFRGAESGANDDAIGQPIQFGREVTTSVTFGNDETAVGGHPAVAPIARNLAGQRGVKCETSPRQRIERGAGAPVQRQKTACLAGRCRSHLGPFHDEDIDPAAAQEVGGAGADHAAAADHDAHGFSAAKALDRWFLSWRFHIPRG